jgi:PIN domain nuclease of toxin-antitoxin system
MSGALLDTHALYWLITAASTMSQEALLLIAESQTSRRLLVSPISAWELSLAALKPAHKDPVVLDNKSPSRWFSLATKASGARVAPIHQKIACEAATVVVDTGHKDPGDCYLIATSRIKSTPLITRDHVLITLAAKGHLEVIRC